jgi:hypothetical protein
LDEEEVNKLISEMIRMFKIFVTDKNLKKICEILLHG